MPSYCCSLQQYPHLFLSALKIAFSSSNLPWYVSFVEGLDPAEEIHAHRTTEEAAPLAKKTRKMINRSKNLREETSTKRDQTHGNAVKIRGLVKILDGVHEARVTLRQRRQTAVEI